MRTVERLDAEIYYEVHGENGPAVAHGRGGNAASWWQHFKQSGNVCLGSFPDIQISHLTPRMFKVLGVPWDIIDRAPSLLVPVQA